MIYKCSFHPFHSHITTLREVITSRIPLVKCNLRKLTLNPPAITVLEVGTMEDGKGNAVAVLPQSTRVSLSRSRWAWSATRERFSQLHSGPCCSLRAQSSYRVTKVSYGGKVAKAQRCKLRTGCKTNSM